MILYFVYFVFFVLNFLMIIFRRKNIFVAIISAVGIIFLMAGNSFNPDYHNYSGWYSQSWYPESVEKGYILIADFFMGCGLSYNEFLVVVFTVCSIVIGLILFKFKANYHIFILMFIGYQMFFDYVQIRCTIAVTLLTLSVFFLSLKKNILSILVLIVAVFFHISVVLYFPYLIFIFMKNKYTDKFFIFYFGCIMFFCMCIFACGNRIPLLDVLYNHGLIDASKFKKYFTTETHFGFIFPFILQFSNLFLVEFADRAIKARTLKSIIEENLQISKDDYTVAREFSSAVKYIVIYSSFSLPLVMVNQEFVRYFRNCNLMVYIQTAIVFDMLVNSKISKNIKVMPKVYMSHYLYLIAFVLNVISWSIIYSPSSIIIDLFSQNCFV